MTVIVLVLPSFYWITEFGYLKIRDYSFYAFLLHFIHCICLSVCAYAHGHGHATVWVWSSQNNFWEVAVFSHSVGPRDWTRSLGMAGSFFTHWAILSVWWLFLISKKMVDSIHKHIPVQADILSFILEENWLWLALHPVQWSEPLTSLIRFLCSLLFDEQPLISWLSWIQD